MLRGDIYLDEKTERTLKAAIKISEENLNEVRFMLNECADTILLLIQEYGKDAVCDKLVQYIIDDYYAKKNCALFAAKYDLSYEIKAHIDGYFQALSYKGFVVPCVFVAYYVLEVARGHEDPFAYNSFLLNHCKTIEINLESGAENIYYYGMWW